MNLKLFLAALITLILPLQSFSQGLLERQQAFQSILQKEKTSEAKIKKAESLAQNKKSKFRVDAVNYLIDQNSTHSGPVLVQLMRDPLISEFAIYGVGQLGVYEATPLLIKLMKNDNRNISGNAFRALQKLYPRDFGFEFHHDDPAYKRAEVVQNIEKWWKSNRERLKSRSLEKKSDKEKQEAEERWEKYGKDYLDRPAS